MKLVATSIFDTKVGAYNTPYFSKTRGEAIRGFTEACKDANSLLSKYPGDYRLFVVGEFDDSTGHLASMSSPEPLIGADELG